MSDDLDDPTLTSRLMSRNGPGLSTRRMADGGEVVTGPTAKRALRAVGARAMTMDHTIFVDDTFDISNPEDAALYAHERHHQAESGGVSDGHGPRDAEEIAARAIERMVLHRSSKGEGIGEIMRDVMSGRVPEGGVAPGRGGAGGGGLGAVEGEGEVDPMAAYEQMLAEGKDHQQIVRELTEFVMNSLMHLEEEDQVRRTQNDFF